MVRAMPSVTAADTAEASAAINPTKATGATYSRHLVIAGVLTL
jgi:hypothetical protein